MLVIKWNEAASLLDERDRFTRHDIEKEFPTQLLKDARPVAGGLLATPVMRNRYTVFWKFLGDEDGIADVRAVLASQLRVNETPEELRSKLIRVYESQNYSRQKIVLE